MASHQQLLAEAGAQLQLLRRELAEAREGWAQKRAELEGQARQVGRQGARKVRPSCVTQKHAQHRQQASRTATAHAWHGFVDIGVCGSARPACLPTVSVASAPLQAASERDSALDQVNFQVGPARRCGVAAGLWAAGLLRRAEAWLATVETLSCQ